eukprot:Gregarina_sp_Pseudo_9__5438@NODE_67_length_4612_cov_111_667396_g62_i0_p2_GENE_NODE_67_length_4612_cov_111_667396_g62_i0NODE_67_length_4612_cov_111_667396_g62_i0_p2_ORF_typecomplete_len235_score59_32EB1/PF03271_17/8_6e03EB1/PF03271_17/0_0052Med21/PF11221_8/0_21DUF4140/PF13600_6/0_58_NODE_67_length_4612_cov_111_667396_g62_i065769
MQKVHWSASQEYEMTRNYKLLQEVFKECGLNRSFEIAKLTKGRQQDNLEFLQWIKYVYDRQMQSHPNDSYKPQERRAIGHGLLPDWAAVAGQVRVKGGALSEGVTTATSHKREASSSLRAQQLSAGVRHPVGGSLKSTHPSIARKASGQVGLKPNVRLSAESARIEELERELKELKEKYEETVTVREFFLNKLKALEFLCTKNPQVPLEQQTVLEILYSEQYVELKMESTPDQE